MHVDESGNLVGHSSPDIIKVEVVDSRGESRIHEVSVELFVERLKILALKCIQSDSVVSAKTSQHYKLTLLSKNKQLTDECTLREEDVSDGDIILLLPRIPSSAPGEEIQRDVTNVKGPSEAEILDATAGTEVKNFDRRLHDISMNLDFQKELRKILVTLIDFTEQLLRSHPDVSPISEDVPEIMSSIENGESAEDGVDKEALQQLVDMGFSTERAKRALKLNNMRPLEAMDWLLAYDSSQSASVKTQNIREVPDNNCTLYLRVPAIVESYRRFKRKQLKVNCKALSNLRQMGFEDNEVLDALWIHLNNEVAACEWLLSDRRAKPDDLKRGLRSDSAIYKSMLQDATVQLGLLRPRLLFAFLQLLEEPNSMGRWLNDSETAPVLSQVFRIYHSEKHAISTTDAPSSLSGE